MKVYLVRLCGAACGPYKLHYGHEDSNDEAADQDYEDPTDVLHAQTWNTETVMYRKNLWLDISYMLVRLSSL